MIKVGELARRTGVTIRTLHHYDQIGLLSPSLRTESGHRLYAADDIARLHQIKSLQELGFSLQEIRGCLGRADFSLQRVIELHIGRLKQRISQQRKLCRRLEAIAERLRASEEVSSQELIQTIEEMTMIEKYFSDEQRDQLKARAAVVGQDRIRQVEAEWRELFQQFEAAMKKGQDPSSPPVQALARQAQGLIDEFTGGNAGIERSVGQMYRQEGPSKVLSPHGFNIDPKVFEYMSRARAVLNQAE